MSFRIFQGYNSDEGPPPFHSFGQGGVVFFNVKGKIVF